MLRAESKKVRIEPDWLTRIILGWKMSEANRERIREWAVERSPKLKVVTAVYDEFYQGIRLVE